MGFKVRFSLLKKVTHLFISTAAIGILSSCGGNIFENMSGKTKDAAVLEEIKKLTNKLQFSEAVELIEANPNINPDRQNRFVYASAYAGACGVTFAHIFASLQTAAGSPMQFMMSSFTNTLIDPPKCYTAQQWIESIGDVNHRSTNENIGMFLIGFSKVGTYLRHRADNDATTGLGDGNLDGGYDSCSNTSLPRDEVKQVVSGFGLMLENLGAIGSNLSGGMTGDIANVSTMCTMAGLDCEVTNPNDVSNADADAFRNAIKSDSSTDLGIESCATFPLCC